MTKNNTVQGASASKQHRLPCPESYKYLYVHSVVKKVVGELTKNVLLPQPSNLQSLASSLILFSIADSLRW